MVAGWGVAPPPATAAADGSDATTTVTAGPAATFTDDRTSPVRAARTAGDAPTLAPTPGSVTAALRTAGLRAELACGVAWASATTTARVAGVLVTFPPARTVGSGTATSSGATLGPAVTSPPRPIPTSARRVMVAGEADTPTDGCAVAATAARTAGVVVAPPPATATACSTAATTGTTVGPAPTFPAGRASAATAASAAGPAWTFTLGRTSAATAARTAGARVAPSDRPTGGSAATTGTPAGLAPMLTFGRASAATAARTAGVRVELAAGVAAGNATTAGVTAGPAATSPPSPIPTSANSGITAGVAVAGVAAAPDACGSATTTGATVGPARTLTSGRVSVAVAASTTGPARTVPPGCGTAATPATTAGPAATFSVVAGTVTVAAMTAGVDGRVRATRLPGDLDGPIGVVEQRDALGRHRRPGDGGLLGAAPRQVRSTVWATADWSSTHRARGVRLYQAARVNGMLSMAASDSTPGNTPTAAMSPSNASAPPSRPPSSRVTAALPGPAGERRPTVLMGPHVRAVHIPVVAGGGGPGRLPDRDQMPPVRRHHGDGGGDLVGDPVELMMSSRSAVDPNPSAPFMSLAWLQDRARARWRCPGCWPAAAPPPRSGSPTGPR